MFTNLKLVALAVLITFSVSSESFSQFSIEAGTTIPIANFASEEGGSAKVGYAIRTGWEKLINEKIGFASGLIFGENSISNAETTLNKNTWSYLALEGGLLVKVNNHLNLKGMVVGTIAQSPTNTIENSEVFLGQIITSGTRYTSTGSAVGFDLRLAYEISKFYISANLLSIAPEFQLSNGSSVNSETQAMTTVGLHLGYKF